MGRRRKRGNLCELNVEEKEEEEEESGKLYGEDFEMANMVGIRRGRRECVKIHINFLLFASPTFFLFDASCNESVRRNDHVVLRPIYWGPQG